MAPSRRSAPGGGSDGPPDAGARRRQRLTRVARARPSSPARQCGRREAKWLGHCPDCGAWDSFVEETVAEVDAARPRHGARRTGAAPPAPPPSALPTSSRRPPSASRRASTSSTSCSAAASSPARWCWSAASPGIGKSTLLLQVLDQVAACGPPRAARLRRGVGGAGQDARRAHLRGAGRHRRARRDANSSRWSRPSPPLRPALVVVDSVQTLYSDAFTSAPGSVSQVREAAGGFLRLAKETGTAVVLVGHVTKEGAIAGPRVLEHMVDTRAAVRGRPAPLLPHACARPRTASARPTSSASSR